MAATQTPPAPTLISLGEYLDTPFHPDCDFVDGVVEERRPPDGTYTPEQMEELFVGEYEHNRSQTLMARWFGNHEFEWPVITVTEQRIYVTPDRQRIRVCDVCLLRADAPRERITMTPPLLCIEILSPRDRIARAKVVLEDYRLMGVPNIWLIDPIQRVAHTFDATGLHPHPADRLEVPGSPIHLILSDLFRALD